MLAETTSGIDPWFITISGAVGAGLVAAVGKVWFELTKWQERHHDELKASEVRVEKKLEACEETHRKTSEQMMEIQRELGQLAGENKALSRVDSHLEVLHDGMLKLLREENTDDDP